MPKLLLRLSFLLLLAVCFSTSVQAQDNPITLTVQAGFGGYFRDSQWMPVIIRAVNNGDPVSGRLVVRPETSGSGIINTLHRRMVTHRVDPARVDLARVPAHPAVCDRAVDQA